MTMFFIFLILLIALALVANRWGFDSRDGIDSSEWEKRMYGKSSPHH